MIRRGKDIFVEFGILTFFRNISLEFVDKAISKATFEQNLSEELSLFRREKRMFTQGTCFQLPQRRNINTHVGASVIVIAIFEKQ